MRENIFWAEKLKPEEIAQWGVTPVLAEEFNSMDVMFYTGKKVAAKTLDLKAGDNVVLTGGPINGQTGNTNTIKLEQI